MFIVAEYWSFETDKLLEYIQQVDGKTLLFDAPLYMNFHQASTQGSDYDLSQILRQLAGAGRSLACGHYRCQPRYPAAAVAGSAG